MACAERHAFIWHNDRENLAFSSKLREWLKSSAARPTMRSTEAKAGDVGKWRKKVKSHSPRGLQRDGRKEHNTAIDAFADILELGKTVFSGLAMGSLVKHLE